MIYLQNPLNPLFQQKKSLVLTALKRLGFIVLNALDAEIAF
jgi:hypothetical protein